MTFMPAPLSVDGATISSALIRSGFYAVGGSEGIVEAADLKVSQLATPGNGLLISAGNAVVTNRYQATPNQAYVVVNPGVHTILPTDMPGSQATPKSYLVLITIGDPEFSQDGHPWMPSDGLDETEAPDYVYVRPYLLEVAAGTTSFDGLGLHYPAYALARVDIPATTTVITNAMITDLRNLARPRAQEQIVTASSLSGGLTAAAANVWTTISGASWNVNIPKWATKVSVTGWVEGGRIIGGGFFYGAYRANLVGSGATTATSVDENNPAGAGTMRVGHNVGGTIAIPASERGTTKAIQLQAETFNTTQRELTFDSTSTALLRLRFEEAPV